MEKSEIGWVNMALAKLPVEAIKPELNDAPTEELLSFWKENKRDQFADDLFDAVRETLQARNVQIPDQQPFTGKKKGRKTEAGLPIIGIIIYFVFEELGQRYPDSFILELISTIVTGCFFGILLGLIPYFIAKTKGHIRFSRVSISVCAISGALLGLFASGPMAFVLTIIALLRKKNPQQETVEPTKENLLSEDTSGKASV